MDWLLDLLGLNKGKATINAADLNRAVLDKLGVDLNSIIDTTSGEQKGYLTESLDRSSLGPNAEGILGDIYGLNGPEGAARARETFQTSPGYDFQMEQGLNALDRRQSSRGMLGSGNTSVDTLEYAGGLADQEWDDWIMGLTGGLDRENMLRGDLATQAGQTGGLKLGVTSGIGSGQMAMNNQTAAGKEAGQGGLWDLLNNVAGVAGSVFGVNSGGNSVKGTGQGNTGANTYGNSKGQFGFGYGGGF